MLGIQSDLGIYYPDYGRILRGVNKGVSVANFFSLKLYYLVFKIIILLSSLNLLFLPLIGSLSSRKCLVRSSLYFL